MAEILPRDVLLRVGGRTLHRTGFLAAMGAGRGYVEVKETFTRAGVKRFRDRDLSNGLVALGRKAANDKVAIEYDAALSGLVDQFGYPYCGPRLEGARTQLVADPENFNNWTAVNVTRTAGQADPFGGTAAYKLDATAGADNRLQQAVAGFTAGTRAILGFLRADPTSVQSNIRVTDNVGAANRHHIKITWTAGVPTLSTIAGSGTLFGVAPWGAGWYAILANADNVGAGDYIMIYPAATAGTGTVYAFGFNAWNAVFPSNYQGPADSAGAGDSLTLPIGQGPIDMTIISRVARPVHADAVGSIGAINPGIWALAASAVPSLRGVMNLSGARAMEAYLDDVTGDADASHAIPAGTVINHVARYTNLRTGGTVTLESGTGTTSAGPATPGFTAFANQTLRVGSLSAGQELYAVLLDLMVLRGLRTLAECVAVP